MSVPETDGHISVVEAAALPLVPSFHIWVLNKVVPLTVVASGATCLWRWVPLGSKEL